MSASAAKGTHAAAGRGAGCKGRETVGWLETVSVTGAVPCSGCSATAMAVLRYEKETTVQLMALAKKVRRKQPRYSRPVDLGGDSGVWVSIVREREAVADLPDTSTST